MAAEVLHGRKPAETAPCVYRPKEYWENRLSERWGLHGVGHISFGLPYNKWLYRVRKHVFRRYLPRLRMDLSQAKVLDIGSGTGFWIEEWESHFVRSVSGLDITDVSVRNLRSRFPGRKFMQGDICHPKVPREIAGQFDVISAFDVLFHITDDAEFCSAIANIAKLLRPGGYFIFSDNLVQRQAVRRFHEADRDFHFVSRVLESSGLSLKERGPMFVVMNTPFDTSTRLPLYLWRLFIAPVHFVHLLGHLYGAILYPLECLLTGLLREGPSTEIVICQKGT